MTWEKMSERLQPDPVLSGVLKGREETQSALKNELSAIMKQYESGAAPKDLDGVWARWVDHLFIVSGLLD